MLSLFRKRVIRLSLLMSLIGFTQAARGAVDESTLVDMLDWQNILPFDGAFASPGHENSLVKVYYNEAARSAFAQYEPGKKIAFAPGSIISKAFIDDKELPRLAARRFFFMEKMPAGFDPEHGDWFYTSILLDKRLGQFEKVASGALPDCIACHKAYATQDYVLTLDRSFQAKQPIALVKQLFQKYFH